MTPVRYELWDTAPTAGEYVPYVMHFAPSVKKSRGAIVLVPGSGYRSNPALPKQEGERVAEYLAECGINVFMLIYRVFADGCYPYPLLDGRRTVRLVRYRAEEFGIDPNCIVTLGYSAGGHLCASLTGYRAELDGEGVDEVDKESYVPNYQALCYPVISFDTLMPYTHCGSVGSLLGTANMSLAPALSFEKSLTEPVPPTFLFHNFDDTAVGVQNSLLYACRLRELGSSVELHIYPHGGHGVGYATDDKPSSLHNRDWLPRFVEWMKYNNILDK